MIAIRQIKLLLAWVLLPLLLSSPVYGQQADVTLRSTVKGNREQPKVLYIMPWHKADQIEIAYRSTQRIAEDVFSSIDREEFLRELRYREQRALSGSKKE